MLDYIHAYMRHWNLYEEQEEEEHLLNDDDGDDDNGHNNNKNKREKSNNVIFRYDWLIGDDYDNDDGSGVHDYHHHHGARKRTSALVVERDIQTLQDRIIQFVIHKKKKGLGANGIDNYINPLRKFYWVNGIKGIDWELVRSYRPEHVKKTQDRE